jgi:hypothetical protein
MNSTPLLAHTHQSLVEHLVGVACRAKAAARFFQLHDRSDLQKCRRWREKAFDFESCIPSDDPAWNGVQWRIRDFGKNLPAWIESLPFNTPVEQLAKRRAVDIYTLVVFQHQSALGNAPAHKLFNLVAVRSQTETKEGKPAFRSSGSEFPRNLEDYDGEAPQR